ncbi:uncharacterized protein LOC131873639 [Cryptomeria japonica]|uniref:uncharacterized protein LOC131873639 n=1 Tax=Cryptomeria japonica TaxID=3369 RepID=UPI0027DA2D9C|nr:uncharacterized protein LOC131873639 [Cryptomeria japonica]
MVFDQPPCNNWEVPLYFLRKLYCEFILGEKPNYFDIRQFQDRGRGSVQDRPGAHRVVEPQHRRRTTPKPMVHVTVHISLKESMELQTLQAATSFTDVIVQHGTQLVGAEDVPASAAPPSSSAPPSSATPDASFGTSRPFRHMCPTCQGVCYGVDTDMGEDALTSHLCTCCGSRCHASTTEHVALTDELINMLYPLYQTQGAASGGSTPHTFQLTRPSRVVSPPEFTPPASRTPRVRKPSSSNPRQKKISSRTPKRQKKHMGFTELMNAPDVNEVQQREEAPSKLPNGILLFYFSRSPTRILWDPTRPRKKLCLS